LEIEDEQQIKSLACARSAWEGPVGFLTEMRPLWAQANRNTIKARPRWRVLSIPATVFNQPKKLLDECCRMLEFAAAT